jgi:hypothetical protein
MIAPVSAVSPTITLGATLGTMLSTAAETSGKDADGGEAAEETGARNDEEDAMSKKSPRMGGGVTRLFGRGPCHAPIRGHLERRTPNREEHAPRCGDPTGGELFGKTTFSISPWTSTDLQQEPDIPEVEEDRHDLSQNLEAGVGNPISFQKLATVSASDSFFLPGTIVQPSSSSPSGACCATRKGIASLSLLETHPSEARGENRDPLDPAAGDPSLDGSDDRHGAKVRRRRRVCMFVYLLPPTQN